MITNTGAWLGENVTHEHCYDPLLASSLNAFFFGRGGNVVDLGCGLGDYVKTLRLHGLVVDGFDGNPATPKLTNGMCKYLDLTDPINLKYDWVLSLEVGEHIPKQYEERYIKNLHQANRKGIILSWAVEGQPGFGHVNCHNNDYIKEKFAELGYFNDIISEIKLRESSTLPWFRNTIMVFLRSN